LWIRGLVHSSFLSPPMLLLAGGLLAEKRAEIRTAGLEGVGCGLLWRIQCRLGCCKLCTWVPTSRAWSSNERRMMEIMVSTIMHHCEDRSSSDGFRIKISADSEL